MRASAALAYARRKRPRSKTKTYPKHGGGSKFSSAKEKQNVFVACEVGKKCESKRSTEYIFGQLPCTTHAVRCTVFSGTTRLYLRRQYLSLRPTPVGWLHHGAIGSRKI